MELLRYLLFTISLKKSSVKHITIHSGSRDYEVSVGLMGTVTIPKSLRDKGVIEDPS